MLLKFNSANELLTEFLGPWSSSETIIAAAGGNVSCLKYALDNRADKKKLNGAHIRVQLDIVKFWVEKGLQFDADELYLNAAKEGNLEVVEYLYEQGKQFPGLLVSFAAKSSNTKLVQWIFDRSNQTLTFLSAKSNLQMVKFLAELGATGTCDAAAQCGSLEVVRYLHEEKKIPVTSTTLNVAVENGHLDLVKYLMDQKITVQHDLAISAASSGNVDVLKFVHERGLPWTTGQYKNIYTAAISSNSVACMKYAFENGCPLPATDLQTICRAAVDHNALDCLKYAREIGCDWNASDSFTGLCYIAMTNGFFEVFKYLHENGCSLNQNFCSLAARSGRLEFMKYARKFVRWDDSVCVAAAQYIQPTCLKYAHDQGLKMSPEVIREAITCSNLICLKYAVENGCEWPSDVWELAEESESLDVFVYLTSHCPIKETSQKKKKNPAADTIKNAVS